MSIKRLFEIIRSGDCILWAGAGFSRYAGLPLGTEIGSYLNKLMGLDGCKEGANLSAIATRYEKVFGRERLLNDIKSEYFDKLPERFEFHERLSRIPLFNLILTTNYDLLFELGFKDKLNRVISPVDLISIDERQTTFIKLHGDFTQPEKLVITESDYARFLDEANNNLLYNFIKNAVTLHHVVFIGYSLADLNTLVLFEYLKRELGMSRKEWFIITPSLDRYEVEYFKKDKITHVQLSGEDFVKMLESQLDSFVMKDILQSSNPDKQASYLHHKGIVPQIEVGAYGRKLTGIKMLVKDALPKIHFTVPKEVVFKLKDFTTGDKIDSVSISNNDLKDFRINGVAIPLGDTILNISRIPVLSETADLYYGDKIIEEILFETYQSPKIWMVNLEKNNLNIKLKFQTPLNPPYEGRIECKIENIYRNASEGLKILEFLLYASQGNQFIIQKSEGSIPLQFPINNNDYRKLSILKEHFSHLKRIERFYDVKFSNFIVTDEAIKDAQTLVTYIDGSFVQYEVSGSFIKEEVDMEKLVSITTGKHKIKFVPGETEPVNLYGKLLPLRNLEIEIEDVYIKNMDQFQQGKSKWLSFGSNSGKTRIQIQ